MATSADTEAPVTAAETWFARNYGTMRRATFIGSTLVPYSAESLKTRYNRLQLGAAMTAVGSATTSIDRSNLADKALLVSVVVVAMSTIVLPWITGYATALFQLVVLAGWGLVAKLISPKVADVHHELVWPMVMIVNVLAYLLPVSPFWLLFRRRLRNVAVALVAVWLVTYLGLLFVFLPATEGP